MYLTTLLHLAAKINSIIIYRKSVAPFTPTHLSVPVPGVVAGDLSGVNVPLVLLAAADTLVHPLQVRLVRGVDRAEEIDSSASKSSIRRFIITEKAPARAFSYLKAATTAFTLSHLRHY